MKNQYFGVSKFSFNDTQYMIVILEVLNSTFCYDGKIDAGQALFKRWGTKKLTAVCTLTVRHSLISLRKWAF